MEEKEITDYKGFGKELKLGDTVCNRMDKFPMTVVGLHSVPGDLAKGKIRRTLISRVTRTTCGRRKWKNLNL